MNFLNCKGSRTAAIENACDGVMMIMMMIIIIKSMLYHQYDYHD